jgi:hypothetical protein
MLGCAISLGASFMISYEVEKMKPTREIYGIDNIVITNVKASGQLFDRQKDKEPDPSLPPSTGSSSISTSGGLLSRALAIYLLSIEKMILLYNSNAADASISDSMLRFIDALTTHFCDNSSMSDFRVTCEISVERAAEMDIFIVSLCVHLFLFMSFDDILVWILTYIHSFFFVINTSVYMHIWLSMYMYLV